MNSSAEFPIKILSFCVQKKVSRNLPCPKIGQIDIITLIGQKIQFSFGHFSQIKKQQTSWKQDQKLQN